MASNIILITGANSGVGYATTRVLATASKAYHVIMAGRSLEKIKAAKAELEQTDIQGTLSTLQLDVTSEASIRNAAQQVEAEYGHLNVLINNAAVGSMDPDISVRMRACMETNVIGPAVVSVYFRPLLLKSSDPYSIYISSGAGSISRAEAPSSPDARMPNEEAYRASKAALNMLAVVEARDYADKGLKTFAMCPGFVVSNLRGTKEEMRTGGGKAGDPANSGNLILSIIQGQRNQDVGKLVHREGVYPW